jgi:alpha-tubulin suppressor-like RCC1 family protein
MNSLKKWKALHHLNKEFVSQIKLFCVFGENGNEVLVINKNDEVFGFGDNENGCLGLRTDNSTREPIKINELSNKQIIKFSYGLSHVIAITSSGQTYSWGSNNFGQLGDGTTDNRNKPKLIESLINENVIESSCGAYFTLVLTQSGDVYSFGYNCFGQLGCNNTYDQKIPIKVTGFESEKVISISCGYEHSLALTQSLLIQFLIKITFNNLSFQNILINF